jgi:hypothetical protein
MPNTAHVDNMCVRRTPIVQLMVQGGPGTVATVRASLEAGNPVVVLWDSGGAAEAVYEYCKFDRVLPKFAKQEPSLKVTEL